MDGLTFLRQMRRTNPIPVVICSARAVRGTSTALEALNEGATEIIVKPQIGIRDFLYESAVILIDAVRAAAVSRPRGSASSNGHDGTDLPPPRTSSVVAIGASTGGTEAVRVILESLPPTATGIIVVQHMPGAFTPMFAQRLNRSCAIEVKHAEDGEPVRQGVALIVPGDRHATVVGGEGRLAVRLIDAPLVSRHRPSVDVLFRSVAVAAGAAATGVILTGMGKDGAAGLLEMRRAGATTIAQNADTCVVFGMPKEAIACGAAQYVLPLERIAEAIVPAARPV